jgi:hypothetical protein
MVESLCLSDETRIITSLDSPYAISDAVKHTLRTTRQYLLITAPWLGKGFIDLLRNLALKGITISILIKLPEKEERTFYAVESMLNIADSEGWKVKVKFNPYVHAKLAVADGKTCFVSSFNPTDSGMYYNHEVLFLSNQTAHVEKVTDFFHKLWERPENISFQHVKTFYGCKTIDGQPYRKKIAEKILGLFNENGNSKIPKWKVCKEVQKFGYNESDVISVIRDLVNDGVLYEPDHDSYCMVNS